MSQPEQLKTMYSTPQHQFLIEAPNERCISVVGFQGAFRTSKYLIATHGQVRVQPFLNGHPFINDCAFISTRSALQVRVYKPPGDYKWVANIAG